MTASRTAAGRTPSTPASVAVERPPAPVDDDSDGVRLWNLRSEAAFEDRSPRTSPVPTPAPGGTAAAVSTVQWLAWVRDHRVRRPGSLREANPRVLHDWDVAAGLLTPEACSVSSRGGRVVVIAASEGMWYGDSSSVVSW
jgi:hypothetical protein